MGALTETSATLTEFAGTMKAKVYLINPSAATGTVTVADLGTLLGAWTTLAEASATTCCGYNATVATNVATIGAIEGDGTIGSGSYLDFYLLVIGY